LLIPIAIFAVLNGALLAPDVDRAGAAGFGQMFGTCAQVVAALLIVIAVNVTVTTFRGLDLRPTTVKAGLGAGCVALVASIAATSPSLPEWLYKPCFAIATTGGLCTLVAVIVLGWKAIDQAHEGAELLALRRRAALNDSAAREELLELGEPAPN
jgi:hypothetical protein